MAMRLSERTKHNGNGEGRFDLDAAPSVGRQRRLPEIAAGALVIVVCALAALWWQAASSDKQQVLALRGDVERGQVIAVEDLQVVGVDADSAVAVLAETESGSVVGRSARTALPAGTLVVESQFSEGSLLEPGDGVVGLSLDAGEFPSLSLAVGDQVGVVLTPAAGDPRSFETDVDAHVLVDRAIVVEVSPVGTQGGLLVSLQVREGDAARVAAAAAGDRVRLIQVFEADE